MTANHQLINQDSGDVERYTPRYIIEAARRVMGGIDMDPASSVIANEVVQATTIFTREDDGLAQDWSGRVWLNWPFGRSEKACKANCKKKTCVKRGYHISADIPGNATWTTKLVDSYRYGKVDQAVCICFASTSEEWLQPLLEFPICLLSGRTKYRRPDGSGQNSPPKGSMITYLGPNLTAFHREFSPYGTVMVPVAEGEIV